MTTTATGHVLLKIIIADAETSEVLEEQFTDESLKDVLRALSRALATWDTEQDYLDYLKDID